MHNISLYHITVINQPAHMTAPCFEFKLYFSVGLLTFQPFCFASAVLHTIKLNFWPYSISCLHCLLPPCNVPHQHESFKVRRSALANRISLLERCLQYYAENHRRVGYITLVLRNSTQNHNCRELTIHCPTYVLRCACLSKVVSSTRSTLKCLCYLSL